MCGEASAYDVRCVECVFEVLGGFYGRNIECEEDGEGSKVVEGE